MLRSMSSSFRHVVQNLSVFAPGRLQLSITTQQHGVGVQAQGELQPALNGGSHDSPRLPALPPPSLQASSDLAEEGRSSLAGHDSSGTTRETLDVAASAEHHRLTSLSSSVDLRAVAVALERGLPYAILLLLLFLSTQLKVHRWDQMPTIVMVAIHLRHPNRARAALRVCPLSPHTWCRCCPHPIPRRPPPPSHMLQAISLCAYLSLLLFRLNTIIRGQVALKHERRARELLTAAAAAMAHVPAVLLLRGQAGNLILNGPRPSKVGQ